MHAARGEERPQERSLGLASVLKLRSVPGEPNSVCVRGGSPDCYGSPDGNDQSLVRDLSHDQRRPLHELAPRNE